MVDIKKLENSLLELENFFHSVREHSEIDIDVESAIYGLLTVSSIKTSLEKYKKKPENKLLKQIDAGLVSATRGVEYFEKYDDNKRFREICGNIPSIKDHIKW